MESCAYTKSDNFNEILTYLDLVYVDIKHIDPENHRGLTGVENDLILENIRMAAATSPTIVRIPVVPGCNDSENNILETARFCSELGGHFQRIELLPYHRFGTQSYARIGMEFGLSTVEPPDDDQMLRLKLIVESCGVSAQIGG
jgi:pyruvate formate lyase activating enzyme